jgi:hypothetical protein
MYGPVILLDGTTLAENGIEHESFVHPLYELRQAQVIPGFGLQHFALR